MMMGAESAALLQRIRENEMNELLVSKMVARLLLEEAPTQELVAALQENTSIENCSVILRFLDPDRVPKGRWERQVACLQAIASLPSLKEFRFVTTSNGFTDAALKLLTVVLNRCSKLEKLTLQTIQFRNRQHNYHEGGTSEVFANKPQVLSEFRNALSQQTSLETLVLDGTDERFDFYGVIKTLDSSLPSVKHIHLMSQELTNRYDRQAMKDFLEIRSATTTTLSIKRFLMTSDLSSPFFERLASNTALVDLSLDQVGIFNDSCRLLAESLSHNSTLQKLSLTYNGLSDASATILISSLKHNTGLKELNLAGNGLSVESSEAVADLLTDPSSLSTLTSLNLAQNIFLRDEGACIIASALTTDKKITHLNLSEMKLTHFATALLVDALSSNKTLQRLNLSKNTSLGDTGAIHMGNLLKVNKTLQHLNLSGTRMTQKGSEALATALRNDNDTLVSLNLGGNSRILSAVHLQEMMVTNSTLEHLWLPSHLLQGDNSPIPSFLKLNKFGRKRLLQDRNNALLWKSALIEFASDLYISYYLLQMNPAMLSWV